MIILGCFGGYHHLRKHPYMYIGFICVKWQEWSRNPWLCIPCNEKAEFQNQKNWCLGWWTTVSERTQPYFVTLSLGHPPWNYHSWLENPPFWWYSPGKMVLFMGYISFREGNAFDRRLRKFFKMPVAPYWQRLFLAVLGRTGQGGTGHQSEGLMAGKWDF